MPYDLNNNYFDDPMNSFEHENIYGDLNNEQYYGLESILNLPGSLLPFVRFDPRLLESLPYCLWPDFDYSPESEMSRFKDNYLENTNLEDIAKYVGLGHEISIKPEEQSKGSISAMLLPEDETDSGNGYSDLRIIESDNPGYIPGERTRLSNLEYELNSGCQITLSPTSNSYFNNNQPGYHI